MKPHRFVAPERPENRLPTASGAVQRLPPDDGSSYVSTAAQVPFRTASEADRLSVAPSPIDATDEQYVQEHNLRIESSLRPIKNRCKASAKPALVEGVRRGSRNPRTGRGREAINRVPISSLLIFFVTCRSASMSYSNGY
jgi:hypothetical protein